MQIAKSVLAVTVFASVGLAQGAPDNDAMWAAWKRLSAEEKTEAAEWFRFECTQLGTYQLETLRAALALNSEDPGLWDELAEPPHYDPKKHAPEDPIPRKRLADSSKELRAARKAFLPTAREERLRSAYHYDWGSGKILRKGETEDPERTFANAMNGYPPQTDLGRAIVLRALDDGSFRKEFAAFGHTYTDLKGKVYPGLTLYDAWRSGRDMQMPDVDALGVVHDLLDDWTTWVSPVPDTQHDALYERIGELVAPLRPYRELRETTADLFLIGRPVPIGTYISAHASLHALWVEAELDPGALSLKLPDPSDSEAWVREWIDLRSREPAKFRAGEARRDRLEKDREALRRVLVGVLRGMGAFG